MQRRDAISTRRLRGALAAILCALASGPCAELAAQPPDRISQLDRVATGSRIYQQIQAFFPDLSEKQFDQDYREYLDQILRQPDDRRTFDLASMALVATLHDSHTWFYDTWIDQTYGQPIGLTVYRYETNWVVVRSRLATVKVGDVIESIDGTPTEEYFQQRRKYLSGSSERDAAVSMFDTPVLFPKRFTATLDGGRSVVIDREHDAKLPERAPVDGQWLVPGAVGYVRLSAFQAIETQPVVWRYLNDFRDASAVIVDLRGNIGGGDPRPLQQAFMTTPYPMWSESSNMKSGSLLRGYGVAHPGMTHVVVEGADMRPRGSAFTKPVYFLIDRGCTCACEDFTMPFKVTGRARLVGEPTAGSFSFTQSMQFENGMRLNVSAVRHTFPGGSQFEGVGIKPDVEVGPSVQDLKTGRDVVLERALRLATQQ
jgi:carboxyl-terminal processing protease